MTAVLTHEQWLAALEEAQAAANTTHSAGDFTTAELADQLGWSDRRVRKFLSQGIRAGVVEPVSVWRKSMIGRTQRFPGYRIVEKPEKAPRGQKARKAK